MMLGNISSLEDYVEKTAGSTKPEGQKLEAYAKQALAYVGGSAPAPAPAALDPDVKEGIDTLADYFGDGGEQGLHHILQSNAPGTPVHEYAKQKLGEATAKLNAGPHEGDTKVVDGVTYVLKNGRWHKQGVDLDETTAFQLKTWSKMGKPTKGAVNAIVRIDIGGAVVSSSITISAVEELGLKVGEQAYAVIKASDVMIGRD